MGDPPLPPGQKRSLVAEEEEEEAEQHPTEPGENEDAAEDLESASSLASNASSIAFVAPEGASPHRSLPVETHRLIASFLPVPATLAVAACGRSLLGTYRRRFTALRLVTPKDSPVVAATTQASNTADGPALAPPSAIISSILRRQTQVQRLSLDFHPTQWAAPLAGVVDALREGERPDQQCLTGLEVGRVGGTDAQATATVSRPAAASTLPPARLSERGCCAAGEAAAAGAAGRGVARAVSAVAEAAAPGQAHARGLGRHRRRQGGGRTRNLVGGPTRLR